MTSSMPRTQFDDSSVNSGSFAKVRTFSGGRKGNNLVRQKDEARLTARFAPKSTITYQGSSAISQMQSSRISQRGSSQGKKCKPRFADPAEEQKYRAYLKHVKMLNQMKEYLGSMHRSMSKDVVKRLVVSIKRMEEDLNFYENNWELF